MSIPASNQAKSVIPTSWSEPIRVICSLTEKCGCSMTNRTSARVGNFCSYSFRSVSTVISLQIFYFPKCKIFVTSLEIVRRKSQFFPCFTKSVLHFSSVGHKAWLIIINLLNEVKLVLQSRSVAKLISLL